MTGFIIAAIALVLLVVLMKVHITPEEAEELAAYEKAEKAAKEYKSNKTEDAKIEEQLENKTHAGRSVRLDKVTERIVNLMEDGNVAEIRQALNNGINITRPLPDGQTVLMIAVKHNQDHEIVPFLVQNGIDINARDDKGQTALMLAATFNPDPDMVRILLDNGADKTIKDKNGKTAADYCALNFDLIGTDIPELLFVD